MMENIFQNGSKWLRADFHLHTKADREFQYSGTENDFVKEYVKKLKDQNIGVGVITNHNKFEKGEFVSLKKRALENGIGLFAGVEFSLKEGIHILIVFEDAWYKGQTDNINNFLSTAFYGIQNPSTPPYPNSAFDLKDVVEKLDNIGYNYFIILAHIDATNGLCQVLQGRTFEAFIKQGSFDKALAVQKSGNLEKYNAICQIAGKQIACVEGSDNAQEGIDGIGKGKITYLKIGDFNFEAVQYALSDPEYRVEKEIPKIYNSYIQSITFDGGLLNGKKISFSPELNNLIGIRGSGKSSVLEIIRYVLNIPLGAQAMDKNYKDDLIRHVLKSGGKAVVEIKDRHGDIYTVERIYGQREDIFKNGDLQPEITLDAILRQPIYFGQKDLSNKNADFENDLINKLIGEKLKDIQAKIDNQKRTIQRIINEVKGLDNLSQLKNETEKTQANATHQLKIFKDKGVAEKLQIQTSFETDINILQNRHSAIKQYIEDLTSLIQNHEYLVNPVTSTINVKLFEEANYLLNDLKSQFESLKIIQTESQKIGVAFQALIDQLFTKQEELKDEFAKIKREINIPELNPDDFIKINRQLEISKLKLIEINKSENKRIELTGLLNETMNGLDNLWHERYKLLCDEVNKINQSSEKLKIEIIYKGRKDKFLSKFQEVFKGSGLRENNYTEICNSYADFIDVRKDGFKKISDIITDNQLVEVKNRFELNLFDLLTYQVENEINIKYDGKLLKEHSLGQRASALILFLLAQNENDILIIDQPEDDLDNQTIYNDVIKDIKQLKGRMQFIFATHNANIPVLGDSEMLIACQYVPDTEILIESGSIDCGNIQEKIIRIMEGGKEAFNRRKNIYNNWERSI